MKATSKITYMICNALLHVSWQIWVLSIVHSFINRKYMVLEKEWKKKKTFNFPWSFSGAKELGQLQWQLLLVALRNDTFKRNNMFCWYILFFQKKMHCNWNEMNFFSNKSRKFLPLMQQLIYIWLRYLTDELEYFRNTVTYFAS